MKKIGLAFSRLESLDNFGSLSGLPQHGEQSLQMSQPWDCIIFWNCKRTQHHTVFLKAYLLDLHYKIWAKKRERAVASISIGASEFNMHSHALPVTLQASLVAVGPRGLVHSVGSNGLCIQDIILRRFSKSLPSASFNSFVHWFSPMQQMRAVVSRSHR